MITYDAETIYNHLCAAVETLDLNIPMDADDLLSDAATKIADYNPVATDSNVTDYSMYSAEGNKRVAEMVNDISDVMRGGAVTRRLLPEMVRNECNQVAKQHGEVWDTEPQGEIADQLNKVCEELMWQPISRWEW